jgi:predicted amidophosphoribosyltransferase
MCKHDPVYKQSNESMGGTGCPICNAERNRYTSGVCPDCGRNLADDMRDIDPWALCDRCFEQWETWAQSSAAQASAVEPVSQFEDSRDAAF